MTRVTIRDIAKEAGVHFTTVSLALRGSPQIPETTRARVREAADRLGYRPDPMLAALNAYRRSKRPVSYQATIAWINNWPVRQALHDNECFVEYYQGAKQRAEKMGYLLEEFWLREPGMSPERLVGILKARNIDGIILAPQPVSHLFPALDYSDFAVVSLGYSLKPAVFHVVTNHHFHSMNMVLDRLIKLGYKRIGFFGEQDWDEKVENGWLGGLTLARWKNPDLAEIPPLLEKSTKDRDLRQWIAKFRPDAVISHSRVAEWLRSLGYEVPGKMGFASLSLSLDDYETSGVYQSNLRVGEAALDYVISMLHSGERGIPKCPTRILVESEWREGRTIHEQAVSTKRAAAKVPRAKKQAAKGN